MIQFDDNALGLYVHWPYCTRICPYCDFNVTRARGVDLDRWQTVLIEDLHYWAALRPGRLSSIYFGGGTPSLMPPALVATIIETCADLWGFDRRPEITLEANPTDAERAHFEDFKAAHINRLSLGVQSFDDAALSFLGRNHKGNEARAAIKTAQDVFDRVTFDLIYGRPNQSLHQWQEELSEAIETGVSHLSLYQLTIEQGTAFAKAVTRKEWVPVEDDDQADYYDLAQGLCADAGLHAYEVSNHARTGFEAEHNSLYWQYKDYIGIGPGAHGRITHKGQKYETIGVAAPTLYLNAPNAKTRYNQDLLSGAAQATEYLSLGLRVTHGIDRKRAETLMGRALDSHTLKMLQENKFITCTQDNIKLTPQGRGVLNSIVLELLKD